MDRYETWLKATYEEVQKAIEDAEETGWHHLADDSLEARTYGRLLTWVSALDERVRWYDTAKRT